jgi:hypothetical protein
LHRAAQSGELLGCEAIARCARGFGAEDQTEIDGSVAGNGEGDLGLIGVSVAHLSHHYRAGIKDGGQGGEPGLVVVLRAVIGEDGEGQLAFEKFGGPAFPFGEEGIEGTGTLGADGAQNKL